MSTLIIIHFLYRYTRNETDLLYEFSIHIKYSYVGILNMSIIATTKLFDLWTTAKSKLVYLIVYHNVFACHFSLCSVIIFSDAHNVAKG